MTIPITMTIPIPIPTMQQAFSKVRFILVAPRMAANVGSAARAMKTMGFSDLVLVRPPDDGFQPLYNFKLDNPEAIALASGAQDVLSNARIVNHLDEALAGCTQSVALTARPREWGGSVVQLPDYTVQAAQYLLLPQATPTQAINSINSINSTQPIASIAYVFGNERFGLSNNDVHRCLAICSILVNPDYSSLNLAQAVQVVAYSQRLAILNAAQQGNGFVINPPVVGRELAQEPPASHEHIQGMMEHWLALLEQAHYYDPTKPRRLKERLASIWGRAALTADDVDLLRGMASALEVNIKKPK